MTNSKDCPQNSNSELSASLLDAAELASLEELDSNPVAKIMADWLAKLPTDEAHNAARHHTGNKRKLREAGAVIDAYRKTEQGKAAYNAKAREEYVPVGPVKRTYVIGLVGAEKAEHVRQQNLASQAKFRDNMTQADRDKAAQRKRERRNAVKDAEKAAADADLAARRLV